MSVPSQSVSTALTALTVSTTSIALTTCLRCGTTLPAAGVACNQRSCRPPALRRISFIPLASETIQHSKLVQSDIISNYQ